MSVWAALAGGFIGMIVLTAALRSASEVGLTRIDLPFLLGTAPTSDRRRAKALGYLAHLVFGLLFALGYFAIFASIGRCGWLLGALLGVVQGLFAGTTLVNILLPIIHPRMGSSFTAADTSPLVEAPGYLMLNYGRSTFIVSMIAHVAYGSIVGASSRSRIDRVGGVAVTHLPG